MSKLTIKTVNKRLIEEGLEGIELARDKDHFYFFGCGTDGWDETVVYVPRLNDLALNEWIAEARLKAAQYK